MYSEYFSKIFKESSVVTLDEDSKSILEPLRDFDISIPTVENVCSSLVKSKTNKAAGHDGIPAFLSKKCVQSDVENYRQISLQCTVSKIFEGILFKRILYKNLQRIFSLSQFGFRKGQSCIIQMVIPMEIFYSAYESGEDINVIYTDYEKAFNKVNHMLLLQKLNKIGISSRLLKFIQSYLEWKISANS